MLKNRSSVRFVALIVIVALAAVTAAASWTGYINPFTFFTSANDASTTPEGTTALTPSQEGVTSDKSDAIKGDEPSTDDLVTTTTYPFSSTTGATLDDMSSGTTQLVGTSQDDTNSSIANIGFEFWYDGVRFTTFGINANGFAKLGTVSTGTAFDNSTGFASATNAPKIAPFYDDLCTGSNGKVHFKTTGTAPNRKLVVEWQNMQITRGAGCSGTGAGTFQMWLYESGHATTPGIIEFVYGSGITGSNDGGYSIGLQSGAATNFASVTSTGPAVSYVTANNTQTNAITSGTKYTFTPLVPNAPTVLNFTSVTATGMTLNWTDNSTNEFGFAIYRSDDGGSTYNFINQTAANAVSSAQSGLSPGTTYFWRVFAVSEGALSTALSGSQATTAGTTYTWNQTGSASFATAANWTPTRTTPAGTDILVFNNGATTTATGVTSQTIGQLLVSANTNVSLQTSVANSTLTISGGAGTDLDIQSGSTLQLNGATITGIAFTGTQVASIAGTLSISGAAHTYNATNSVTTVTGSVSNALSTLTSNTANLIFNSGSFYNHNFTTTYGTIPTATWNSGSTVQILGYTSPVAGSFPTGSTQTFSNFTWNTPSMTTIPNMSGATLTVGGTFTMTSTGTASVRLGTGTSGVIVAGSYSQTGGTIDFAAGAGNGTLRVAGTFNQSGGTLTESSTGSGNIEFNGTSNQTITLGGTISNTFNYRVNNNAGITLTGTIAITTGASLTISSTAATPISGGAVTYTGTTTLIYNATTGAQTATAIDFPAAGSPTNVTINNSSTAPNNLVTIPFNRTVGGTLTMTTGNISMSGNTLTLGTSAAAPGLLIPTSGFIVSGSFTRFFGTSQITIPNQAGAFPFGKATATTAEDRSMYIGFSGTITTGGSITATFNNVTGTTDITPFVDGAVTVDRRTNSNWAVSQSGLNLGAMTISMRLQGTNIGTVTDFTTLRMIRATDAVGTSAAGTGSNAAPAVNRTAMSLANLGNTFYFGAASGTNSLGATITSIASGNWNDTGTWDIGIVPTSANNVVIAPGHTVTVGTGSQAANALTVNSTGALTVSAGSLSVVGVSGGGVSNAGTVTVSGGTVNVGITDNTICNRTFTNNGTLTVSSGTLNIFGNLNSPSGSTLNQSGGDINVDGNAGGVAANSVANATSLVFLGPAALSNVSLTGGTFTIVDPHASATLNSAFSLNTSATGTVSATAAHTFRFGNGTSTDAGGNVGGFNYNPWVTTGGMRWGNIVIEGPTGTNRSVALPTTFSTLFGLGDLTVNNGGSLVQSGTALSAAIAIGGNVTVNTGGSLTTQGLFLLGNGVYVDSTTINASATTTAQTITNTGTIQNLTASPTANFTNLQLVNSNAAGITLGGSDISLSGALTFTLGKLNTGSNKVVAIAGASTSGAGPASGYVIGNLQQSYTVAANKTFDVGTANGYSPVGVNVTAGTFPANFTAKAVQGKLPAIGLTNALNRYWTLSSPGSITANLTFTYLPTDVVGTVGSYKFVKNNGGTLTSFAPTGTPTSTSAVINGVSSFSDWTLSEPATLTYTAGANGAISGTSPQTVDIGASGTAVTAVPNTGYHFVNWSDASTSNPRTDTNVSNNVSVTANFAINIYTVAYDGNGNTGGTAPVDGSSPYNYNSTVTVLGPGSLVKTGYTFDHWNTAANNSGISYAPGATFAATANTTLYAQWSINQYTVTFDGNGNTGGAMAAQTRDYNDAANLTTNAFTRTGYTFDHWNTAADNSGTSYADGASYPFTASVTLYAQWTINTYAITATAGANGSIAPPGVTNVPYNTSQAYSISANPGYIIADVLVDTVSQGAISNYTFNNVSATHSISATFADYDLTINTTDNLSAGTYNNVTINSPGVVTLTGNVVITGCITVNNGATLQMGAYTITGGGCFNLANGGTLGIGSADGITAGATGNVQVGGTRTYSTNATYVYNGEVSQAVGNGLPNPVLNLTIANTGPDGPTPAQDNTVTGNTGQAVTGLLHVVDGVYESHSDYTDVTIESAGNLTLTGDITVSGNWTNNGGTLTHNNYGVTFDGSTGQTVTGSTTFYNLTKSVTSVQQMNFKDTDTTTVSNALTLTGAVGELLTLRSTSSGNYWNLVAPATTTAAYVDVQDSNNTGTMIVPSNATDSGHNVGWQFTTPTYTLTYIAGTGGTISGTAIQTVNQGADGTAVTAVPNAGYHFVTWDDSNTNPTRTDTNVLADHTYTASFAINTYTITASSSGNGTIAPSGAVPANYGDTPSFTLTPAANYHIDSVTGTCGGLLSGSTFTTNAVIADCTVIANFAIDSYTIPASSSGNGTIAPSGAIPANYGTQPSFTLTPATGYHIDNVTGTCGGLLTGSTFTTAPITGDCTVIANFAINSYTITASSSGNGTIAPSGAVPANYGTQPSFTLTPATGYHIDNVTGTCGGLLTGSTFTTAPITGDCTVIANFAINSYTITASSSGNGTIAPSGAVPANYGTQPSFTLTPATGYHIDNVTGTCGGLLTGSTFTTAPITGDCTVIANFAINSYTITASSSGNGTIAPSGAVPANYGTQPSFTLTPAANYHIDSVTGTCGGLLTGSSFTTAPIASDCTLIANFAIDTYTVTPSSSGNGTIAPATTQTVNYGATTAFTLTPDANYHIDSVTGTCGGSLVGSTFTTAAVTTNCTVIANFAIDTYTVTPSSSGNGTIAPATPQTVNYGATTAFTLTPATGYHIDNVTGTCGGSLVGSTFTTAAVTTNCTVIANFAINQYTVTFDANGGTGTMAAQTRDYNDAANLTPNAFTKTGYTFSGWNTTANGSGTAYADQASYPFTSSVTLYAQWTINQYTVTFDANGGTGTMSAQTRDYGDAANLTANTFTRTGYSFTGWNTLANGTGTSYADQASYPFTSSVTLYAQWSINQITVTFDANGGTGIMAAQTRDYGDAANLTANAFTRTGYSFTGWNTLANGTGTSYADQASYPFTASVTLYAQWTINQYTVTFDANTGTGTMAPQTRDYNDAANLTANTFARTGYSFTGWNTLANGTGTAYADQASYPFTASVTLYAQWTINQYSVSYDGNGNTAGSAPATQTADYNTAVTLSGAGTLVKTGYTFSGWNTAADGSGTAYAGGASFTIPASNTTLYAQWTINQYTVTFDANGGTGTMAAQTRDYNDAANLTANAFTRTGYTFDHWNTAADNSGTSYADGASYPFTATVTLYAQWTINQYTVTFDANGGTGTVAAQTRDYNDAASLTVNAFTRTGYTFDHWNTAADNSGTSYADGASYPFTSSVTLYAQWTINQYTVTFDGNGNTGGTMAAQTRDYNDAANLTANAFTKTGYTFSGWNTAANGSGTAYADQAPYPFTSSVTLHAQWTINQYTVTPSSSGNGTIAPATPQTVNYGATPAFTLTPDANYHIDSVTGTCGGSLVGSTFTTAAVTTNCTVIANFASSVNVTVSLPSGLTALTNTILTIPVTVSDTTGNGIVSYDFSLTYDPAVLSPAATPYDTTGTLSSNFTITPNTTVSGSLQMSGYDTASLSGAGTLIYLRFNVLASPPACSAFSFSAFMFNEGVPGTILSGPGGMCVNTGNISGQVTYGTSPALQTVPSVTLSGAGSPNVSTVTDANGLYDLTGFGSGAYTVTPSKTGDFGTGIITGFDASLAAQHAVNLISLNANQRLAADVSGNGAVTSFDAALIAQFVVGIVGGPPNQSGTWKFIPPSRFYANVWTDYTSEDYTAILKGDVSGNWTPTGARVENSYQDLRLNPVLISLAGVSVAEGSEIVIPVNVSDLTNRGVYSFDFELRFDPNVLELNDDSPTNLARTDEESMAQADFSEILSAASFVEKTNTLSNNYSIAVNKTGKGVVRITGYGIVPLQGAGELLKLKFRTKKGFVNAESRIIWSAAGLNEGGIPLTTVDGNVRIVQPDEKQ